MLPDADLRRCDPTKDFDTAVLVPGVNSTATDAEGSMSSDGLTFYLRSTRAGGPGTSDLYYATRTSTNDPFGTPQLIPGINTPSFDEAPVVSGDGLKLFFGSTRGGSGFDIYVAERATAAGAFGAPTQLLGVNIDGYNDVVSYANHDGTELWFASDRTGNYEIYSATRSSTTTQFGTPTVVGSLANPSYDYTAVLTDDALTVLFQTDRGSPPTAATADIWMAKRSTTSDGFGAPAKVPSLNSPENDAPSWVSGDGCEVVIVSNRSGGLGGYDLWLATRPL